MSSKHIILIFDSCNALSDFWTVWSVGLYFSTRELSKLPLKVLSSHL